MNAGRPRPRRRLEREVHQCLPEDDGLRSAHGRGGPGSRPRRRPSRRCSKRRPLVVELGEVAGEGRILERPDPSSLASRRRAVGVGRSSVAADTRAAAGGGRCVRHATAATGRRRRRGTGAARGAAWASGQGWRRRSWGGWSSQASNAAARQRVRRRGGGRGAAGRARRRTRPPVSVSDGQARGPRDRPRSRRCSGSRVSRDDLQAEALGRTACRAPRPASRHRRSRRWR